MSEISYRALFDLTDKVAVVTGGAGILGQHFCAGLAESGAKVAVVDIMEEPARELAKELTERYAVSCLGIGCDVSQPISVASLVRQVVDEWGKIDILHNNAATKSDNLDEFFAPFEDYKLEEWRKIMSVNLDGMFLVAQAVGKQMVTQGTGGSIVQTSSIYGILAPDSRVYEGSYYLGRQINTPAVYSASKAGVIGLTTYLSAYWASQGIRVNSLVLGGVDSGQNTEFKERYSARVPLGRMAQATEVVSALLYLVSDASKYVTGQTLIVDGGLSAW
ncbi:SDR family oxidoreductase [Spirulina sp. CCNP1310]|uniref:SDR family oxidoreductase n=1 Tax=Spirulina sp. CCNP1310 TaxID=3110249 RepID=UPI002B1FDFB6|nr:SDR family oxidoreductase [Spirulina sp. CCNP1310]MEA5421212.1 SDR family oxidoreductase [Spirulina sp. CCNP1310]